MTEMRRVSCRIWDSKSENGIPRHQGKPKQGTNLLDIVSLIFLVCISICVFESGFVLVRISRHETLNGNQDRLKPLSGGPFFTALTAPCSINRISNLSFAL